MTDTPLDLEAIKERTHNANHEVTCEIEDGHWNPEWVVSSVILNDVPALISEVEQLRKHCVEREAQYNVAREIGDKWQRQIAEARAELEKADELPWIESGKEWPIETHLGKALEALR